MAAQMIESVQMSVCCTSKETGLKALVVKNSVLHNFGFGKVSRIHETFLMELHTANIYDQITMELQPFIVVVRRFTGDINYSAKFGSFLYETVKLRIN